jgi:site-specific recombinase XerD
MGGRGQSANPVTQRSSRHVQILKIPVREKLFFRIIYETQLRPFEALNLLIENWDREQQLVTAVRVKQKTAPVKGDRHRKILLPSKPRTAFLTENTNLMLKTVVSNRKKGYIFVNADGEKLSMAWFKDRINHYAKLLGIQKDVKYYDTQTGETHPPGILLHAWLSGRQARYITIRGIATQAVTRGSVF